MELDPKAVIGNVVEPVKKNVQRIGNMALGYGEEFVGLFLRPEVAAQLVREKELEKLHEDELLLKLEVGIDDHETRISCARSLIERSVTRLKISEAERNEDDTMFLKRTLSIFDELPAPDIGVAVSTLSEEEKALIFDYILPDYRK